MKVLVFASCILAAVSAGWAPYHGPIHHPVIHKGVPVEPAEVQHARAEHLAALAKAEAQAGPYHEEHHEEHHHDNHHDNHYEHHDDGHYDHHQHQGYSVAHVSHPVVHHYDHHEHDYHHEAPAHIPVHHHHIAPAYETSHVIPAIDHDGRPLDTPEVEAAKAHHFAAVHQALSLVATQPQFAAPQQYYRKRRSIHAQHYPIIDKHGVPVEPLEVQHARAEHLAAHAAASHAGYGIAHDEHHYDEHAHEHVHEPIYGGHVDLHESHHGYTLHQDHAPVYGHHGHHAHSYFTPKYDYHGHPLDTDEVEHAKAIHFAAHAKLAHHHYL